MEISVAMGNLQGVTDAKKYEHVLKGKKRGGENTLQRVWLATLWLESVYEPGLKFYSGTFSAVWEEEGSIGFALEQDP